MATGWWLLPAHIPSTKHHDCPEQQRAKHAIGHDGNAPIRRNEPGNALHEGPRWNANVVDDDALVVF